MSTHCLVQRLALESLILNLPWQMRLAPRQWSIVGRQPRCSPLAYPLAWIIYICYYLAATQVAGEMGECSQNREEPAKNLQDMQKSKPLHLCRQHCLCCITKFCRCSGRQHSKQQQQWLSSCFVGKATSFTRYRSACLDLDLDLNLSLSQCDLLEFFQTFRVCSHTLSLSMSNSKGRI